MVDNLSKPWFYIYPNYYTNSCSNLSESPFTRTFTFNVSSYPSYNNINASSFLIPLVHVGFVEGAIPSATIQSYNASTGVLTFNVSLTCNSYTFGSATYQPFVLIVHSVF